MSVFVFAEDSNFTNGQNGDQNSSIIAPCFAEGQSMAIVPGNVCCSGLSPIQPTQTLTSNGECGQLVGASVCSNCGNGVCEQWENKCNCTQDCQTPTQVCTNEYAPVCGYLENSLCTPCPSGSSLDCKQCKGPGYFTYNNYCLMTLDKAKFIAKGDCFQCGNGVCESNEDRTNCSQDCGEIITQVKEQVKCVFNNAIGQQECSASNGASCIAYPLVTDCASTNDSTTDCIGGDNQPQTTSCTVYVSGAKGEKLVWKSSCGGYAYTILDGQSESAEFNCGTIEPTVVKEQVKCVFKNSTEKQKCYAYYDTSTSSVVSSTTSGVTTSIAVPIANTNFFSCTSGENGNYETCLANVEAQKGTKLIWKSSCGGYAYTIIDGQSEYATFDCQGTQPPVCACTKDYNPVCGSIKICTTTCATNNINSNETSTCQDNCYEQKKTYGNVCEAKCAGAQSVSNGACELTCPVYVQPNCPNGKIEVTYDDRGCKKPRCVAEEAEHFSGAYFKCSNGMEFKQADACMPYASWKEKARNTCAQYSAKCGSNTTTSGGTSSSSNPATGNFILDAVATATSVVTNATTTATQTIQPMEKCIGGEVYLTAFETFGSCTPGNETCKYYVDESGCKVKECVDGQKEKVCPTDSNMATNTYRKAYWQCASGKEFYEGGESSCKPDVLWKQYATESCAKECGQVETACSVDSNVCQVSTTNCGVNAFRLSAPCYDGKPIFCSTQSEEEVRAAKEKCYKNNSNAELRVEFNSNGCRTYTCANQTQVCNSINDLPAEKKISCEERGGQLMTKVDDQGCLTYIDCVGEQIIDSNAAINTNLIKDKIQLLELAIKIETAKIELEKTASKLREIAKYYAEVGKEEDANRFTKAANILDAAANKLNEIKTEIKNNVDNFSEEQAKNIREIIRNIKEELLKDALLEMLG